MALAGAMLCFGMPTAGAVINKDPTGPDVPRGRPIPQSLGGHRSRQLWELFNKHNVSADVPPDIEPERYHVTCWPPESYGDLEQTTVEAALWYAYDMRNKSRELTWPLGKGEEWMRKDIRGNLVRNPRCMAPICDEEFGITISGCSYSSAWPWHAMDWYMLAENTYHIINECRDVAHVKGGPMGLPPSQGSVMGEREDKLDNLSVIVGWDPLCGKIKKDRMEFYQRVWKGMREVGWEKSYGPYGLPPRRYWWARGPIPSVDEAWLERTVERTRMRKSH